MSDVASVRWDGDGHRFDRKVSEYFKSKHMSITCDAKDKGREICV